MDTDTKPGVLGGTFCRSCDLECMGNSTMSGPDTGLRKAGDGHPMLDPGAFSCMELWHVGGMCHIDGINVGHDIYVLFLGQ
jgi:hypothetical protein